MSAMAGSPLLETWQRYWQTRGHEERNALVLHYLPLVRGIAAHLGATLPANVDVEDLASFGLFGLIDAIGRFDPTRGVRFKTFATRRIQGSIIDELRALDWVPRRVRARVKDMSRAQADLEARFGRNASDVEVAEELGVDVDVVWTLRSQIAQGIVGSLGLLDAEAADGVYEAHLPDAGANPEDQVLYESEVAELLADAVMRLPERQRAVLVLYLLEELTLAEIGVVLGLTLTRVCQLQSKLLQQLRAALGYGRVSA